MAINETALEINNSELINQIRTDSFMNRIYQMARHEGLSETEMLTKGIILLLNLKEEAFQEKVDELMRSPAPLIVTMDIYTQRANARGNQK